MKNKMRPIHPGEILREEMEELGLSANMLASILNVPANRICAILNGERSISADSALRLARYFGTTPEFWMNLQIAFDIKTAQLKNSEEINRTIHPRAA